MRLPTCETRGCSPGAQKGDAMQEAFEKGIEAARRGGTDKFAVPIRNDDQGHMSVGDPEATQVMRRMRNAA